MSRAESPEIRRKRLRWRSWHRGTREMDLLVGGFADAHLAELDEAQLDRFEALLQAPDPELYDWMTGRSAAPPGLDHDVLRLMQDFKFSPRGG